MSSLTITTTTINTTLDAAREINNNNFSEVKTKIDPLLAIFDSSSSNINISGGSGGILTIKSLIVPLGQTGITVGNHTFTDSGLSVSEVSLTDLVDKTDSIIYSNYAVSQVLAGAGVITIAENKRTLVLDPDSAGLNVEISASPSNKMKDLYIINLSQGSHTTTLNLDANWVENGNYTNITIPYLKNIHLRYINDANTSTQGWYIVSNNGCTLNV